MNPVIVGLGHCLAGGNALLFDSRRRFGGRLPVSVGLGCFRLAVDYYELDVKRPAGDSPDGPVDRGQQPVFQPGFGRFTFGVDYQPVPVPVNGGGAAEPGVKGGLGHLHLQLAQNGLPKFMGAGSHRRIPDSGDRSLRVTGR